MVKIKDNYNFKNVISSIPGGFEILPLYSGNQTKVQKQILNFGRFLEKLPMVGNTKSMLIMVENFILGKKIKTFLQN